MKIFDKHSKTIKAFEYKDGILEIWFHSGNSCKYKVTLADFYMFNTTLDRGSFFHSRIKGKEI